MRPQNTLSMQAAFSFRAALLVAFAALSSACGVGQMSYDEEAEVAQADQTIRSCTTVSDGNASRHCYCDVPRADPVLVNTSDCLPGSNNYNNYGSTAACLDAFTRACNSGSWMPGSGVRQTTNASKKTSQF